MLAAAKSPIDYDSSVLTKPASVVRHGQGKTATTILADQGDFVTIITDEPYKSRCVSKPLPFTKGSRANHRSTFTIRTQPHTDYTTSSKMNFGGSKTLAPAERPVPFPSQHTSQFSLGGRYSTPWLPQYKSNFHEKGTQPYYKLHWPTFENKMNMNDSSGVKTVLSSKDGRLSSNYGWTQYNRVHNKLGVLLGPGVPRSSPIRRQYNVLTGDEVGPAWKENNKRMSGNRLLYHGSRKQANNTFIY